MQVVLSAVIVSDSSQNYGPDEQYYKLGGGACRPPGVEPEESFNVRSLVFRPGEMSGDMGAQMWLIPGGLALLGPSGESASLAGRQITITISDVQPE